MDFARKQLEKYGWTDGKGLGKNENGISEALKPKLKRSVTGVGHDAASDFTEHWWTQLYDKAASNVEVKQKNGKTKKIKTKEDEFEITNSTWKLKKKQKKADKEEQYADFFVRKAVLSNGGSRLEKVDNGCESEEDEKEKKDVFKMTDEELFAACEGRTAHKGARHGLKATGKLARIAQQEEMLLVQPKFEGYSHAKKLKEKISSDNIEETDQNCDVLSTKKMKKKRRKERQNNIEETLEQPSKINNQSRQKSELIDHNVEYSENEVKKNKKKHKIDCASDLNETAVDTELTVKKSKKKKLKEL